MDIIQVNQAQMQSGSVSTWSQTELKFWTTGIKHDQTLISQAKYE